MNRRRVPALDDMRRQGVLPYARSTHTGGWGSRCGYIQNIATILSELATVDISAVPLSVTFLPCPHPAQLKPRHARRLVSKTLGAGLSHQKRGQHRHQHERAGAWFYL